MPGNAPLRVTVEIRLRSGDAAGQRRFRLSSQIELPARLSFAEPLPIAGQGAGHVRFALPAVEQPERAPQWIEADAQLLCDPEHPERGSAALLLGLDVADLQRLEQYVEGRVKP